MISIVAPRADQQPPGSRSAINAGTLCECLTASRGGGGGGGARSNVKRMHARVYRMGVNTVKAKSLL